MRNGRITNHDVAKMHAMAREGHTIPDIAAEIGCSLRSVYRYAGESVRAGRRARRGSSERYRHILTAWDALPRGERHDLVGRFGFANFATLKVRVCQIRKRLNAGVKEAA